jgi:hypothetical protein
MEVGHGVLPCTGIVEEGRGSWQSEELSHFFGGEMIRMWQMFHIPDFPGESL